MMNIQEELRNELLSTIGMDKFCTSQQTSAPTQMQYLNLDIPKNLNTIRKTGACNILDLRHLI